MTFAGSLQSTHPVAVKFVFEFLVPNQSLLPGGVARHVAHGGQALQGFLQVVLDVVGPVDGTCRGEIRKLPIGQ